MADVAIRLKARNAVSDLNFQVTDQMLDELLQAARQRGLAVDRPTLQGARSLVVRLFAREIARYVFGQEGEVQRAIRDDPVIQVASRLAANVRSQQELFDRAALAARAPAEVRQR
jgi:hypothetical protein